MALTARDIMTSDPVTIGPEATVVEAARLMTERGIGSLPVVDAGRLVGLVSESDLIMQDVKLEFPTYIHLLDGFIMYPPAHARFEDELKKAVAATVGDVMTPDPVTIQADASVSDVATVLAERGLSRLPVLEDDVLVGIVSKRDIVRAIAEGLT